MKRKLSFLLSQSRLSFSVVGHVQKKITVHVAHGLMELEIIDNK